MTREESQTYRRECPYDAMGDYSVFWEKETGKRENRAGFPEPDEKMEGKKRKI